MRWLGDVPPSSVNVIKLCGGLCEQSGGCLIDRSAVDDSNVTTARSTLNWTPRSLFVSVGIIDTYYETFSAIWRLIEVSLCPSFIYTRPPACPTCTQHTVWLCVSRLRSNWVWNLCFFIGVNVKKHGRHRVTKSRHVAFSYSNRLFPKRIGVAWQVLGNYVTLVSTTRRPYVPAQSDPTGQRLKYLFL